MSFYNILNKHRIDLKTDNLSRQEFSVILQKNRYTLKDFLILISDNADKYLEEIAQKAASITNQYFGKAVTLFTPLYISSYCSNSCLYCSFATDNKIERMQLNESEIEDEISEIAKKGIQHILVLTGEAPNITTFDYLKKSLFQISKKFSSVAIEVYPLSQKEYRLLISENIIDSLTIYQETYNEELYNKLHKKGPKSDFIYRLDTPDRACKEGIRSLTIGALLGLTNFKEEVLALALHIQYLQKKYPETELTVSFPRIRPQAGKYEPEFPVNDRELTRIVTAFRILFPSVGITMSTRENPNIREGLLPIGVTKISAGVSTSVGGHTDKDSSSQFEIADNRSVREVCESLIQKGFQPVMHNWDTRLIKEN